MDNIDRRIRLRESGWWTEGLGPLIEWDTQHVEEFQRRHNEFWSLVAGMMPDNEQDEPFWMTEAASSKLADN